MAKNCLATNANSAEVKKKKNPVGTFYQQIKNSGGIENYTWEIMSLACKWCTAVLPTVHWLELGHMATPNRKQDWNVEKADGQDEGEQTC